MVRAGRTDRDTCLGHGVAGRALLSVVPPSLYFGLGVTSTDALRSLEQRRTLIASSPKAGSCLALEDGQSRPARLTAWPEKRVQGMSTMCASIATTARLPQSESCHEGSVTLTMRAGRTCMRAEAAIAPRVLPTKEEGSRLQTSGCRGERAKPLAGRRARPIATPEVQGLKAGAVVLGRNANQRQRLRPVSPLIHARHLVTSV